MKVGFGTPVEGSTAVAEEETTTALVPAAPTTLATSGVPAGTDDMVGEFNANDLRLPRINLVNKSGQLSDKFSPGSFVLNQEIVLSDGKSPLTVIALRMRKQYQLNKAYDPTSKDRPEIVDTAAEVRERGGALGFKKDCNQWSEIAHVEFLVAAPAGADEDVLLHFTDEVDGVLYARAIYTAASTAYSAVAKTLITARTTHLKECGLAGGKWVMTSQLIVGSANSWYAPVLKAAGVLDADAREQVSGILG